MPKQVLSNLDFNNVARAINLPDPASAQEPATRAYVDAAVEGLAPKDSVRVSTQSNLTITSPGATIDGITLTANDRVLVRSQTTASENGIYVWNGAAVAMTRAADANTSNELEQAIVSVEEGTDANTSWRQTSVNFVIGSGSVAWISFGAAVPTASTSTQGKVQLATQSEVDAGTDALKAVTPATLASRAGQVKKYSATFGDGSATQYDLTHNLGTLDIQVEVYKISTGESILCDVLRFSTTVARLNFSSAPTTNQFRAVIVG